MTPDGNPNRAGRLNDLSSHLSTRYEREGKLENLTQAIKYSQEAVNRLLGLDSGKPVEYSLSHHAYPRASRIETCEHGFPMSIYR